MYIGNTFRPDVTSNTATDEPNDANSLRNNNGVRCDERTVLRTVWPFLSRGIYLNGSIRLAADIPPESGFREMVPAKIPGNKGGGEGEFE